MLCKIIRFCIKDKNKPSERCTSYMHLISWIHPRGSKTYVYIMVSIFSSKPKPHDSIRKCAIILEFGVVLNKK
jgi:hypothetical protein